MGWQERLDLKNARAMKRRAWPLLVACAYLVIIGVLGGLRADHFAVAAFSLLDYISPKSRQFLRCIFPVLLAGAAFDSMRYYYWAGVEGHIRVAEPYYRDLNWFGLYDQGTRVTPNELFQRHHWVAADFIAGVAYLTFIAEFFSVIVFLTVVNQVRMALIFSWSFFWLNIVGYATYFIYPAAPPWYVTKFGLGPAIMYAFPDSGAAVRFDQIFHTHFFDQMYGRGIDVYGAYPSLHVTYPLLVVFASFLVPQLRWAKVPATLFYFVMCFSAVYLQHHYVVDILLGTTYTILIFAGVKYCSDHRLFAWRNVPVSPAPLTIDDTATELSR